jgi:hypothetical protein
MSEKPHGAENLSAENEYLIPLQSLKFEDSPTLVDDGLLRLQALVPARTVVELEPIVLHVTAQRQPNKDLLLNALNSMRVGFAVPLTLEQDPIAEPMDEATTDEELDELEADLVFECDFSGLEASLDEVIPQTTDLMFTATGIPIRGGMTHVWRARPRTMPDGTRVEHPVRKGRICVRVGRAELRTRRSNQTSGARVAGDCSRWLRGRWLLVDGHDGENRYDFEGNFDRTS